MEKASWFLRGLLRRVDPKIKEHYCLLQSSFPLLTQGSGVCFPLHICNCDTSLFTMEAAPLVSAIMQIEKARLTFSIKRVATGERREIMMVDWVHPAYPERWEMEDCTEEM